MRPNLTLSLLRARLSRVGAEESRQVEIIVRAP